MQFLYSATGKRQLSRLMPKTTAKIRKNHMNDIFFDKKIFDAEINDTNAHKSPRMPINNIHD